MSIPSNSIVELSQQSLKNNIDFIQQFLNDNVTISAVVKGNAYGHGWAEFIPMAMSCGINHFSVATSEEAMEAIPFIGDKASLMVMGIYPDEAIEWMITNEVEFFVGSISQLKYVVQKAQELKKGAKIHIEMDTGTFRLGLNEEELPEVIELLKEFKDVIHLYGIASQLSGVGKANNEERVKEQYLKFSEFVANAKAAGLSPKYTHIDSSISTLTCFDSSNNMVRVGTSIYGIWVNYLKTKEAKETLQQPLQRVMSWKTKIYSIREVPEGEYIGYGTSYKTENKRKVAILPVGYYDGYRRKMPDTSYVLIEGKYKAPIIGLVNMNSTMVDVSGIEEVETGDEVILLGDGVDIEGFFSAEDAVNGIEIPCQIHPDIPRKIID